MVECYNDIKCNGYHEHCDPHLPHHCDGCDCCKTDCFCGEKDILSACPVPVCPCNPCWDNCRCTDEIKKLKKKTDEIDNKTNNFDGRLTKVEKDIVNFNSNLTQQIGDLAEKEQEDVDNLQSQINSTNNAIQAEVSRATAAEDDLLGKINKEITDRIAHVDQEQARATTAETNLNNKIEAETTARIADVNTEESRAKIAEEALDQKIDDEITNRIADVNLEESRARAAEQAIDNKLDTEIANRKADAVASAEYNKNDVKIYFRNKNGQVISTVDAKDFIVDGMVSRVYINNRELIIDWNADAGIQTTRIPLDQIFNPDNYYTKAQVNDLIDGVNDRIDTSNQNISNVSNRVDSLSSTVSGNTTQINNLSQQITNYGTQIDDLLSRVAALEQLWYNNNGVITAVGGKPVLTTGTSTAAGFYDSLISA